MKDRQALFDTWAKDYDRSLGTVSGFPFDGYEKVLESVLESAEVSPGMSVLDVGAGTGNLTTEFVRAGCRVWAADFSEEMLGQLHAKVPGVTTLQLDLSADWTALRGKRFERVVAAYVFHEFDLDTKVMMLKRLAEYHLREKGRIVVGDIAFPGVEARNAARLKWADVWDKDEHYFAADETAAALRGTNLTMRYEQVSRCAAVMTLQKEAI